MALRIRTLGSLSFAADAADVVELLEQPVRAALLVVLAVERELSRERLLALLWPERDPAHARHALNQTLYLIRRDLGADLCETNGDRVRAAPGLQADVQDFQGAIAAGRWDEALTLYEGEFLQGWFLTGSRSFEEWAERHRADLRRKLRQAFRGAIQEALDGGRMGHGLDVARRWAAIDPLEDEAHHRMIELHAKLGERATALERFEEYRRILGAEELVPLEETVALAEHLRKADSEIVGTWSPEADDRADRGTVPVALTPPPLAPAPLPSGAKRSRRGRVWAAATAWVVVVGGMLALPRVLARNHSGVVTSPNRVLVAPLENETGDPTLDPIGRLGADWIISVLGNDDFLQVVPREVADVRPSAMGVRVDAERSAPALAALGVARANGAGLLLSGRYYRWQNGLELHASLIDARTSQVVESFGPVRCETLDPMEAVGVLGQRVRVALAVRLDSRFGGMLNTSGRPPNYEAFRAYAEGLASFIRGHWDDAIASMDTAMRLAPDFVDPLTYQGFSYLNVGRVAEADSVAALAYQRRGDLTRYDALRLEILRGMIAGDPRRVYDAAISATRIQPGGSTHYVAGMEALRLGRPREALQILSGWDPYREAVRPWAPYWSVVTGALHVLREHNEELRRAREARQRLPDRLEPLWYEARALAALGRTRELERVLDASERFPLDERLSPGQVMVQTAEELAAHGHDAAARELAGRGVTWLRAHASAAPRDVLLRQQLAEGLLVSGEEREAYETASALHRDDPGNLVSAGLACALAARAGLTEVARECAARLQGDRLRDGPGAASLWRARVAAALGDSDEALGLLQRAFGEGLDFGAWVHTDPFLSPLKALPGFLDLVNPSG